MSGYILCQTKKARSPYFIQNISTNIYTLEELCYYLYHNIYLVDQTIINEALCSWIAQELELPRLAAKLRPKLGKFASAEDILYPVSRRSIILHMKSLAATRCKAFQDGCKTPVVREKKKGDALVENGMLVSAIHVYEKLLKKEGLEQGQAGLTAQIYHNLGCACSYLFNEKAVECFWHAHQLDETEQSLITYLLAYKSIPGHLLNMKAV